jgi:hypothetical protein
LGVGVGDGDAGEETSVGGVSVSVVDVVAPAVAEDDELASNWWGVKVAAFGDGGLEDWGARGEQLADGGGNGLALTLGLACVLEAEVVHVCGGK